VGVEEAFFQVLQGLSLIGNAVAYLIKFLFAAVGVDIPDWVIQLATIIVLIISLLAVGSKLNKIILVILVILLVSSGAGLLSGLLSVGQ
jgi:hypothetical protein